ncbi:hypothetical protein [uncultured Megasphaera sp.]|uniref:hypothetical protein n=1 Tax=uncultured Megasphaera sp. TaxID=165188 RepID=UPI0025D14145|nr:hypothetical protein [uncultured Megasphaera sp.]
MSKKAYIYINYPNIVVLKCYLDVVKAALTKNGYSCEYIKDLRQVSKKDLIVFPMGKDAYIYYHKGYRNYILWQQGVTAEESYLRHRSNIRRVILNYMDDYAMKKAKVILYVSTLLRSYYESVSHCSFKEKSYIMPCFNESLRGIDLSQKDYDKFRFTYVGSLSVWQCFDETLNIYKRIEELVPNASIKILTFQEDEAQERAKKIGIKNYEIKTVPKEQVRQELKDVSYGFVIRKDNIVNRVATPTKLSSYLASGVLPIYSTCLRDFCRVTSKMNIALPLDDNNVEKATQNILDFINMDKNKSAIESEIVKLFSTYYSKEYHTEALAKIVNTLVINR